MRKLTLTIAFTFILFSFSNEVVSRFQPHHPSVEKVLATGHFYSFKTFSKLKEEALNPELQRIQAEEWYFFSLEKDWDMGCDMSKSRAAAEAVKEMVIEKSPTVIEDVEITANRISPLIQKNVKAEDKLNIPQTIWTLEEIGTGATY